RSVTEFYSDLKVLWEELEIYSSIPKLAVVESSVLVMLMLCALLDTITISYIQFVS
ncbi:hypothetical protein A2U01_0076805, partial [Trifolium medium]|nr:hypothetical protein [Trifolium medium]